ncbi:MAG: DUF3810 domain-containing protein [Planctomycetes bacterium]|nr:DUF3810 domain-containing protein [Planctomycetota bacterium]
MADGDETVALKDPKQPLAIGVFALFTPAEAMPRDRGLRTKKRLIILLACTVFLTMFWGASQSPEFVENVYANGWSQYVTRGIASVTSMLPTSVGELLLVVSLSWFLFPMAYALYNVARRRRRFLNALACGFLKLAVFLAVVGVLFQLFWGLNYSRAPFVERQQWQAYADVPEDPDDQIDELYDLCEILVHKTNATYFEYSATEESKNQSYLIEDAAIIDQQIEQGYQKVQKDLKLPDHFAISRGPAKPFAASFVMDQLRISGVYLPWTAEANYNNNIPDVMKPQVIAHEKAHQRGIASESEANFFGYLVCINSEHPYIQYSGYLFAQRQMLWALMVLNPKLGKELLRQRYPGVQADVNAIVKYWEDAAKGPLGDDVGKAIGEVSQQVNDKYLKANGVKAGVNTYSQSALLIITHYRRDLARRE